MFGWVRFTQCTWVRDIFLGLVKLDNSGYIFRSLGEGGTQLCSGTPMFCYDTLARPGRHVRFKHWTCHDWLIIPTLFFLYVFHSVILNWNSWAECGHKEAALWWASVWWGHTDPGIQQITSTVHTKQTRQRQHNVNMEETMFLNPTPVNRGSRHVPREVPLWTLNRAAVRALLMDLVAWSSTYWGIIVLKCIEKQKQLILLSID